MGGNIKESRRNMRVLVNESFLDIFHTNLKSTFKLRNEPKYLKVNKKKKWNDLKQFESAVILKRNMWYFVYDQLTH